MTHPRTTTTVTTAAPAAGRRPSCRLRPLAAALGLAVLASVAPGGGPALAADPADPSDQKQSVDSAIDAMQEDLGGTSAALRSAYAQYEDTQTQLPAAQQAADAAEAARVQAQQVADQLTARLTAAQGAQAAAEKAVDEVQDQVESTQSSIGQIASSAYRDGGVPDELAMMMGSQSPADFASRSAVVSVLSDSESAALATYREQRASQQNASTRLAAVREEVASLQQQAQAQLAVAQEAEQQAQAKQAAVEALLTRQQQAVDTITARKAEEQARLDQLQAQSDALGAQLARIAEAERQAAAAAAAQAAQQAAQDAASAAAQASGSSASSSEAAGSGAASSTRGGGPLSMPVNGPLTSGFGYRIHPIYHYRKLHTGQDWGVACGTPIHAAADGTVVSAGPQGSYGNLVVLDHGIVAGQPLATAYAHMSKVATSAGARVSRGDVIGYVGTTGSSTGCHLHLETRVAGTPVDPMQFF